MSATRVCPVCGERDEFPEFWTAKCEAAVAADTPEIGSQETLAPC